MEGDPLVCCDIGIFAGFLPTPSHGGRRDQGKLVQNGGGISTHALTWRATPATSRSCAANFYFYPRPHMEGDSPLSVNFVDFPISTHALTWRATLPLPAQSAGQRDFYPRPHMEGDTHKPLSRRGRKKFLPTPSHGGRQLLTPFALIPRAFLPTPSHGGRRPPRGCRGYSLADFYPRPHMEGDHFDVFTLPKCADFYPRPHMEGDACRSTGSISTMRFLPTPSHGGRPYEYCVENVRAIEFLPTPSHGGRRSKRSMCWQSWKFLPTPSHGGRLIIEV